MRDRIGDIGLKYPLLIQDLDPFFYMKQQEKMSKTIWEFLHILKRNFLDFFFLRDMKTYKKQK